jgi:Tfp pilus assembly protein PilF
MDNLHFALADYQQALELDPTNWDISCRIAVVHCELGVDLFSKASYEKAEKQFTAALRHNPKVGRFYLCRARARNELKVGKLFFPKYVTVPVTFSAFIIFFFVR